MCKPTIIQTRAEASPHPPRLVEQQQERLAAALHPTLCLSLINCSSTSSVAHAPTTSFLESTMRAAQHLLFLFSLSSVALGQTATSPAASPSTRASGASISPVFADLDRLQTASSRANLDLAHMRIEVEGRQRLQAAGARQCRFRAAKLDHGFAGPDRQCPERATERECGVQVVSQSQCSL